MLIANSKTTQRHLWLGAPPPLPHPPDWCLQLAWGQGAPVVVDSLVWKWAVPTLGKNSLYCDAPKHFSSIFTKVAKKKWTGKGWGRPSQTKSSKAAAAEELLIRNKVTMQKASSLFLFRSAVIKSGERIQLASVGLLVVFLFCSPLPSMKLPSFPATKLRLGQDFV